MFGTVLCATILIIFLLHIYASRRYDFKEYYKIPGRLSLPLLGNTWELIGHPAKAFRNMVKYYGPKPISRFMLGTRPYVIATKAPGFEAVLRGRNHLDKGDDYKWVATLIGNNLLTEHSKTWVGKRNLLTPAFHLHMLKNALIIMNEQSRLLVDKLQGLSGPVEFDIFPHVVSCTLDILGETTFGTKLNSQLGSDAGYSQALVSAMDLVTQRALRPWLHPDWVWRNSGRGREFAKHLQTVNEYTRAIVVKRKAEGGRKDTERMILLDLLLEAVDSQGVPMSDTEIQAEIKIFMVGGFDTTATASAMTLYMLAVHPDVQQRVKEEVDEVTEGDPDKTLTFEDLTKLKYLDCCIKETLRLYPSIPLIMRKLQKPAQIEGFTVPAKTNVVLPIYLIHRDPQVYPEPKVFDPDRFADPEKVKKRHPFAFLPFSAGPRDCIGSKYGQMAVKTVVATVVSRFKLSTPVTVEKMNVLPQMGLKPVNGIQMVLEPHL